MVLGRAAPGPWNFGLSRQLTQAPQSLALHPSQEPQRARRLFSTFARSCTSIPTSSPSVLARSVEYPRSPRCQRPDARDTEPGLARGLARNARIGRPRRREARQRGGQRTRRARAAMPVGRARTGRLCSPYDGLPASVCRTSCSSKTLRFCGFESRQAGASTQPSQTRLDCCGFLTIPIFIGNHAFLKGTGNAGFIILAVKSPPARNFS